MKNTIQNIRRPFFLFCLSIIAIGVVPTAAFGQTPTALFQQANEDYQNSNFKQAAEKYDSLIRIGYKSAELYNNLGNAYYRLGYIAPTILAYERAALLAPSDNEIQHNLSIARNLTADNIIPLGESMSDRVINSIGGSLSIGTWSVGAVIFAWGALILFALFLYSFRTSAKRWAFYGFILSLLLGLACYGLQKHEEGQIKENPFSIVTASNVTAKSEPSLSGGDAFSIHEGTKVRVEETLNKWTKIRLADGKIGWIPSDTAEKI